MSSTAAAIAATRFGAEKAPQCDAIPQERVPATSRALFVHSRALETCATASNSTRERRTNAKVCRSANTETAATTARDAVAVDPGDVCGVYLAGHLPFAG